MSLESVWCYACVNHSKNIPNELLEVAMQLSKEYKHIIYCCKQNCLVVANDNMYADKSKECEWFER